MSATLVTLKAEAYDCLAQIEHWQRQLTAVNQKIQAEMVKNQAPSAVTLPDKASV